MKKYILYTVAVVMAFLLGVVPMQAVWATGNAGSTAGPTSGNNHSPASNNNNNSGNNSNNSSNNGGSTNNSPLCSEYANDPDLWNAAGCGTTTSAETFANNIISVVISLIGLVAIGVMIFGGIMYVTSTGDAAKVQRAKHIIMYGLIGLLVVLLAYAIVLFVGRAVSA